jgi:membrane protein implicated in regulation of membrane protease activity
MMGGALGLAVLASVAAARTHHLLVSGHGTATALTGGYHVAFVLGAILAIAAAVVGATFVRTRGAPAVAPEATPALEAA